MDAVSFEMFKFACGKFYNDILSEKDLYTVNLDKSIDAKGNVVQYTYHVKLNDEPKYTLNLYTTKCSLLVNGKHTDCFLKEDIPKIHELMTNITIQGRDVNIDELNMLLKNQLQKLLDANNAGGSETNVYITITGTTYSYR